VKAILDEILLPSRQPCNQIKSSERALKASINIRKNKNPSKPFDWQFSPISCQVCVNFLTVFN
jgi:hypothetical protein